MSGVVLYNLHNARNSSVQIGVLPISIWESLLLLTIPDLQTLSCVRFAFSRATPLTNSHSVLVLPRFGYCVRRLSDGMVIAYYVLHSSHYKIAEKRASPAFSKNVERYSDLRCQMLNLITLPHNCGSLLSLEMKSCKSFFYHMSGVCI